MDVDGIGLLAIARDCRHRDHRPLHHAHLCQATGDRVSLSQALAGQGLLPLARTGTVVVGVADPMATTGQLS